MLTLWHAPGTCAMGIHVILEETGKPYQVQKIDFPNQAQYKPEFTSLNPKSKVPTLIRDDGSVLTEWPAIALWLGLTNPEKKLIPTDAEGMARAQELMAYATSTVHMQAWTRYFRTFTYSDIDTEQARIKARGLEMFTKGMDIFSKSLGGKNYLLGDFSVADCALYFLETWAVERGKLELPANVATHYERMKARPSVQVSRKFDGFA